MQVEIIVDIEQVQNHRMPVRALRHMSAGIFYIVLGHLSESSNARQGIKTMKLFCGCPAPNPSESSNARQGIKT